MLHFLPFLMPEARLWGFNHLRFLSPVFLYVYIIGGLAALAMFFPPLRRIGEKFYGIIAASLFENRLRGRWLIVSGASLVIFWIGRLPIFLLGDSYSIVENIGNDLPVIFKWSEIGSIYLAYFVARIIPVTGSQLGEYSYGIIAVVSGAATIYIFCALAYELGRDAAQRLLIFCLSICAGWMVLFFGYTENYPILWPFMTGYIYFGIRHVNNKGSLVWPTLMVLLALVLHLQTLFFLISYPVLFFARGQTAVFYKKSRTLVWVVGAIATVVAAIVFIQKYQSSLEFRLYLIPLLKGYPATPHYSLFSPSHLMDILNELLLMVPLLPVLIVLGWHGWRRFIKSKVDLFLLLLSLGGIAFLSVIDPKLGLARDWDLFALSGLAPMLFLVKSFIDNQKVPSSLISVLALLSLLMAMPFVATNLSRRPAIDNYKYLLNLDLPKSRTGLILLRKVALADNDSTLADSLYDVIVGTYPATHQAPRAYQLAGQGRYAEAMILVDSMASLYPHSIELYNLRGTVNLKLGKYGQAVLDLERAAELGRYDARPLVSLASAYNKLGQHEMMLNALRRAQKRDPNLSEVLTGLLTAFYFTAQYDSALVYAQEIMKTNPTSPGSYWVAGNVALKRGDSAKAKIYLTRFSELVPDESSRQKALELLKQLE
jgi:tetratricopeptide (TPR) repeat protein